MDVGQVFISINPKIVFGEEFYKEVSNYINELRSSGDNVILPGDEKLSVNKNMVNLNEESITEINDFLISLGYKKFI